MSARAIVQAALGHVLFVRGQLSESQTSFEAALAAEPRLVRALLGLVEIYLERAERLAHIPTCDHAEVSDWLSRADHLLERAMAINAGCEQGKRLRKRVHTCRLVVDGELGSIAV
jgi:hypothetical protein